MGVAFCPIHQEKPPGHVKPECEVMVAGRVGGCQGAPGGCCLGPPTHRGGSIEPSGYPNQRVGSARSPGTPHSLWATFRCQQLDRGQYGLEGVRKSPTGQQRGGLGWDVQCPLRGARGALEVPHCLQPAPHSMPIPTGVTEAEGTWQAGFRSPLTPRGCAAAPLASLTRARPPRLQSRPGLRRRPHRGVPSSPARRLTHRCAGGHGGGPPSGLEAVLAAGTPPGDHRGYGVRPLLVGLPPPPPAGPYIYKEQEQEAVSRFLGSPGAPVLVAHRSPRLGHFLLTLVCVLLF